jgi:protein-tyrosine phosphatase
MLHGYDNATYVTLRTLARVIATDDFPLHAEEFPKWPLIDRMDYSKYSGRSNVGTLTVEPLITMGGSDLVNSSDAEAIVSLCRLGTKELMPAQNRHLQVTLLDEPDQASNPHLDFLLWDTASVIDQFVRDGLKTVVHCVQAQSRTPTVVAAYLMRYRGFSAEDAIVAVSNALPDPQINSGFRKALQRLG